MKDILFLTGTRADYGKLKPLMKAVESSDSFNNHIFVCGMHLLDKFGSTYKEVIADNYKDVYVANDINLSNDTSYNLAETIRALEEYVLWVKPDMIVVHGDRMDALAGAIVGALNNIIVAHVEGGELSGTIDDSIRHAITKFAHLHFVCNEKAAQRLRQLGEDEKRIFVIGSPDIDVMLGHERPSIEEVKLHYDIPFDRYAIVLYHPVTTEYETASENAQVFVDALIEADSNFVVVYPNNDLGNEFILAEYERLKNRPNFKLYTSISFEYFLTLLEHSSFILGNSSAGVRESGVYGVPAIDVGTRQKGRYDSSALINLQHVGYDKAEILNAVDNAPKLRKHVSAYGKGGSATKFTRILNDDRTWNMPIQKEFHDQRIQARS